MSQYDELKRLAEAALNELTEINQDWPTDGDYFDCQSGPEFEYLCAANPVVVMTLIAENQQLRTDRDYCRRVAEHNKEVGEQLRAEIAGLKTGYQAYERVNAELKAENEALLDGANFRAIQSLRQDCEALRKALGECAGSLHGEMLQKFGGQLPEDMHPVTRRDYGRDMAELAGYRAAIGKGEQS